MCPFIASIEAKKTDEENNITEKKSFFSSAREPGAHYTNKYPKNIVDLLVKLQQCLSAKLLVWKLCALQS